MSVELVEALVQGWLEAELDYAEDARLLAGPVSDGHRESQLEGLSIMFDEAHEALLGNDYRRIATEADEVLKAAGLPAIDHAGIEFKRLCRRLLLAKQDYTRIEADRWNGEHGRAKVVAAVSSAVVAAPSSVDKAASSSSGPLFSVVVDKYFAEHQRPARIAKPLRIEYAKFIETIGGDRAIGSITKADARTYKEHLQSVRKLAGLTVVKHFAALQALFNWASSQGFVPDGYNPAKGITNKKQARKQMNTRRPFTDEELLAVFGSQDFIAQRAARPERFWLCLICLFSICRRDEAGQLTVADVQEAEGIPFIRITDEGPEQSLKNDGSRRRLPVHSSLVRLGFLDYVKSIRQAGHVRLFPQLKRGANGFSDPIGKWFSRCVTNVGLTDPALVLHSLRHGGITKLHGAGCPHSTVELLAGHAAGNVHGQYVHRDQLPLSLLKDGLEKLRYDAVVDALMKG